MSDETTGLTPEEIADLESKLEPEGFELSDDSEVQAKQILESAAAHADDEPEEEVDEEVEDALDPRVDEAPEVQEAANFLDTEIKVNDTPTGLRSALVSPTHAELNPAFS